MESLTLARQAGHLSSTFRGQAVNPRSQAVRAVPVRQGPVPVAVCRASAEGAEEASATRRGVLAAGCASLALALGQGEALAAYGEAANVFGAPKGRTDFYPYAGKGFRLDIPAKWNPSKELGEFANVKVRFEDNFDATNNLVVIAEPTSLKSVKDLGPSPLDFMEKYKFLLGVQSFDKETASEGGFTNNATVTAAVLDATEEERDGTLYYKVSLLSRTADGDEGGKHQLFTAAVFNGTLYILKVQAGDKRWFKGAKKFVEGTEASFTVG